MHLHLHGTRKGGAGGAWLRERTRPLIISAKQGLTSLLDSRDERVVRFRVQQHTDSFPRKGLSLSTFPPHPGWHGAGTALSLSLAGWQLPHAFSFPLPPLPSPTHPTHPEIEASRLFSNPRVAHTTHIHPSLAAHAKPQACPFPPWMKKPSSRGAAGAVFVSCVSLLLFSTLSVDGSLLRGASEVSRGLLFGSLSGCGGNEERESVCVYVLWCWWGCECGCLTTTSSPAATVVTKGIEQALLRRREVKRRGRGG